MPTFAARPISVYGRAGHDGVAVRLRSETVGGPVACRRPSGFGTTTMAAISAPSGAPRTAGRRSVSERGVDRRLATTRRDDVEQSAVAGRSAVREGANGRT